MYPSSPYETLSDSVSQPSFLHFSLSKNPLQKLQQQKTATCILVKEVFKLKKFLLSEFFSVMAESHYLVVVH